MEKKLKNIINKKGKICVALDFNDKELILQKLREYGNYAGIFKIHCDIINDFDNKFINDLLNLKKKYNFLIWEDRKFCDIGFITNQQVQYGVHKISKWADIITCHSVCGIDSIPKIDNMIVFLVIELSVSGHLCDYNYINKSVEIANKTPCVLGVVCQSNPDNLDKNILRVVPGISFKSNTKDNYNQQYSSVNDKKFSDLYVVGRAIKNMDCLNKLHQQIYASEN